MAGGGGEVGGGRVPPSVQLKSGEGSLADGRSGGGGGGGSL